MSDATKSSYDDEEIRRRVIEQLDALDAEDQRRVLDFSRELTARRQRSGVGEPRPVGDMGGALLAFAGTMDREALKEIRRTVEEDCERIDEEGW